MESQTPFIEQGCKPSCCKGGTHALVMSKRSSCAHHHLWKGLACKHLSWNVRVQVRRQAFQGPNPDAEPKRLFPRCLSICTFFSWGSLVIYSLLDAWWTGPGWGTRACRDCEAMESVMRGPQPLPGACTADHISWILSIITSDEKLYTFLLKCTDHWSIGCILILVTVLINVMDL
jgi:hypothetical protein